MVLTFSKTFALKATDWCPVWPVKHGPYTSPLLRFTNEASVKRNQVCKHLEEISAHVQSL